MLIAGHSRLSVYLANLTTSIIIAVAMYLIGTAGACVGIPLLVAIGLQSLPLVLWSDIWFFTNMGMLDSFRAKMDLLLYDLLPTCQLYQYTNSLEDIPKNIYLFPVYSILLIAVLGTVGAICFRKKNLK